MDITLAEVQFKLRWMYILFDTAPYFTRNWKLKYCEKFHYSFPESLVNDMSLLKSKTVSTVREKPHLRLDSYTLLIIYKNIHDTEKDLLSLNFFNS
jgi:hypothetical protein